MMQEIIASDRQKIAILTSDIVKISVNLNSNKEYLCAVTNMYSY